MKIPKRINVKTALIFVVIGILITSGLFYVFAATPSSPIYIGSGPYPGAPSYTVWREGSNYFVKDANGQFNDGTNASQIIDNLISATTYEILIKGGTYLIDSTIVVDYPIIIRGEGNETILQLAADVNLFNVTSSNVKFYDFYADGNGYEGNGFYAQSDSGIMNVVWQNLRIKCFGLAGINIQLPSAGNCWIIGNRITLCDQAIFLGSVSDCFVKGNDLGATTYNVIQLGGAHNLVEGNRIYMAGYNWSGDLAYHAYRGIEVYNAYYMTIVGNQIVSNGGSGILLNNATYTTIEANYINENDRANDNRAGIRLYGDSSFNDIVGNTINNVGGNASQNYGIHEESGDYNNIVGCNAWNQITAGILITGANTKVMSSWNGTTYIAGAAGPAGPPGTLEGEYGFSYLIWENATSKYLQRGSDGSIITSNADASVLVQYVVDNYANWWLHFTDGVFECNTQVNFGTESYFMISGSGWATELELNANLGTGVDFWEFDYTASTHGRFIIKDLFFDMAGDTYTSRDCISIVGGERWKLQNIKVVKPHRDGLNIDETGGDGYTRYNTIESFQVYYAGRYGVYCDGRDNNFFDIQIEYSYDTCFVFDAAGVGNSLFRLHATGAHNSGQIGYTSQRGEGNNRYSGLEVLGTVGGGNTIHAVYLDRCNKTGAYITGSNNALMGGRVYECNYQAGSSGYADVWINGDFNRVIGMELNGQAANPTNYGVHLDTSSNNCTVIGNIGRDHTIAHFQDDGTNNQVGYNG